MLQNPGEVVYFLRTITNNTVLSPLVHSFAWVGVLSTDDENLESIIRLEEEHAQLLSIYWDSINWDLVGLEILQSLSLHSPNSADSWKLLGPVLALVRKVNSLFLLVTPEGLCRDEV